MRYPQQTPTTLSFMVGIITFLLCAWPSGVIASEANSTESEKFKDIKLLIPVPNPGTPEVSLRAIQLKKRSRPKSLSVTELITPLVKLFIKLDWKPNPTLSVENAAAFQKADSLFEAPMAFNVTARFDSSGSPSHGVSELDLTVARRAVAALKAYQIKPGTQSALLCLDVPALAVTQFQDQSAANRIPASLRVAVPADELSRITIEEKNTDLMATLSIHDKEKTARLLKRWKVDGPIRVSWDRRVLAQALSNSQSTQCALTLSWQRLSGELKEHLKIDRPPLEQVLSLTKLVLSLEPADGVLRARPIVRKKTASAEAL